MSGVTFAHEFLDFPNYKQNKQKQQWILRAMQAKENVFKLKINNTKPCCVLVYVYSIV